MSLGAIDFGPHHRRALSSIVENVVRQLGRKTARARATPDKPTSGCMQLLLRGKQVGTPMFFGVLIIAVVLSADSSRLSGIEGKNVSPDGADGNARPGRIIGAGAYFNACAVLISNSEDESPNATI